MNKKHITLIFIFCILFSSCKKGKNYNSCQNFVQNFYDWYVPATLDESGILASNVAIKEKEYKFDPILLGLLKEESKKHFKKNGDISGLDFDPFLATQDPYPKYNVLKATIKNDICFAEIEAMSLSGVWKGVSVVVELKFNEGEWRFKNFHYGRTKDKADENLIDLLKEIVKI